MRRMTDPAVVSLACLTLTLSCGGAIRLPGVDMRPSVNHGAQGGHVSRTRAAEPARERKGTSAPENHALREPVGRTRGQASSSGGRRRTTPADASLSPKQAAALEEISKGREPGYPDIYLRRAVQAVDALRRWRKSGRSPFSAEAQLHRVRRWVRGLHRTKYRNDAIRLLVEATDLTADIPPSVQGRDELESKYFYRMLEAFDTMRRRADERLYGMITHEIGSMEVQLENHERIFLKGQKSRRARALLAEGQRFERKYRRAIRSYKKALARLSRNKAYQRARDRQNALQEEARLLSVRLGLAGYAYSVACQHQTHKHKRLCAIDKQITALSRQLLQMERGAGLGG